MLLISSAAKGQIITTIAGIDTSYGFSGDGGPAIVAQLNAPLRARPDKAGNIYIADAGNSRIRKINTDGIITTVAGNGSAIHSGDDSQATAAGIETPSSITVDSVGNLYIAENNSSASSACIRKVDTSGVITSFAGGISGYSGDGGPATAAGFDVVYDVTVDSKGNVYIADGSHIRKVNTDGIITTIAGNGSAIHSGDGGPATAAGIGSSFGISVDSGGNLYIIQGSLNSYDSWVRKVNTAGIITNYAGNGLYGYTGDGGQATDAEFSRLDGVAVDGAGNVYIGDEENARIRKVSTAGIISTIAGNGSAGYSGDGGPATAAGIDLPVGVAVDATGNIYIADSRLNNIRKISAPSNGVNALIGSAMEVLHIWPDPNNGTFTINISSATNESTLIIITNLMGQKVKEVTVATNKKMEIQLDGPPGMYFLTAVTGQERQSAKVLVR